MSNSLRNVLFVSCAVLVGIQFLPYGKDHSNPPVQDEPAWSSPEVRALTVRACFDCHSNETKWPWYTHVAPASWLVANDVEEGRAHLNFSQWKTHARHADDAAEEVREGEMPPAIYLPLHRDAKLSEAERKTLSDAYAQMWGESKAHK